MSIPFIPEPHQLPRPPLWAIRRNKEKQKRLNDELDELLNCCVCGANITEHRGGIGIVICPSTTDSAGEPSKKHRR